MNPGIRNTQRGWKPGRGIVSWATRAVVCLALGAFLLTVPGASAQRQGERRAQGERPAAPMRQGPRAYGNARPRMNPEMRPGVNGRPRGYPGQGIGGRPGQPHLQEWLAQHQNLSPQEQENMLRREPGFNRLAPEQQQRIVNRLRTLDARPPEQRQRILQRNEMFERLSPEQKQDLRGATQSWAAMPPARKAMMTKAFNDLREVAPEQRQEILDSARFSHTFTPEERHVLGSLLSIEPYEPR